MTAISSISIRRACRDDVAVIVAMLADDHLGRDREQLVQWAIEKARARGCKLVELLTHQSRVDAQRFYKRLGFAASHVGMIVRF